MLRRIVFSSIVLICSVLPLMAETLPDYVVTANREEEEILDVPAQVTVVTSEEIAASGKTSVTEVLEGVAGVTFRGTSPQVTMRGFGENSHGRVLVLVDGRKLNNPDMNGLNWQSVQLSSIERIEILDGPAAVTYGSGAIGGVINIITRESGDGLTAEATISYGSFNTKQALITCGYGTDSAGFLVSADIFRSDGYRERSKSKKTNVMANGYFDITDMLTIKPYLSYFATGYQLPGDLTEAQFDYDPTMATKRNDEGTEIHIGGGFLARFEASDRLTIELPVDYLRKKSTADWESRFSYSDKLMHQFDARPKASYKGAGKIGEYRISGGFDFEGAIVGEDVYSDEKRTNLNYDSSIRQFTYAPYVAGALSLPKGFELEGGVRGTFGTIAVCKDKTDIDETDNYKALSWDVALNWRPTEDFSSYARFNTLFRIPFVDEKAELWGFDSFNKDLDPEKGWNAEIGAKYRIEDFLAVTANAYYMLIDDEIAYDTTVSHNTNLDKTRRIGGTIGFECVPVKIVTLTGNVGYVRATFAKGEYKNNEIPLVSALTADGAVSVKLPLGLSFDSDVSYTGAFYQGGDTENDADKIDGYTLVGITLGFAPEIKTGSIALLFRMDNLLDIVYSPTVYYSKWQNKSGYYPGDGRSYTVSVSYKY